MSFSHNLQNPSFLTYIKKRRVEKLSTSVMPDRCFDSSEKTHSRDTVNDDIGGDVPGF